MIPSLSLKRNIEFSFLSYNTNGEARPYGSEVFFENLHNENDMLLQMQRDIQLAKYWLDKRNIKNYHFSVSIDEYFEKYEKWFDVKLLNINFLKLKNNFPGLDNSHPGWQAQETVAKNIIELTEGLST